MTTNAQTDGAPSSSGYAPINGLEMYYEIHGVRSPLILIPGGLNTISMMGQLLPALAETRQVIAVEPQGHGHTADIDRPLTYEHMADDIAALITYLGLERADVFGFSMGGGVALQTAIRHPEMVRKLVIVSAPAKRDGIYSEIHALEASFDPDAPFLSAMRDAYANVAPRPQDWPQLVVRVRQLLAEDFDWTQQVAAIREPTLIVVGDADTVRPEHAVEMFTLLGGATAASAMGMPANSQLAVLPGVTEFGLLSRAELLRGIIALFLDASMPDIQTAID